MWVLSTATYSSNTRSSPPAHVADGMGGFFLSVCNTFRFWTGLVGWPQGPFHTGLVSISPPTPQPITPLPLGNTNPG